MTQWVLKVVFVIYLGSITKVLLRSSDKSPGWTLIGVITRVEETRSLLILAYIGHRVIDPVIDMLRLRSGRSTIQDGRQ